MPRYACFLMVIVVLSTTNMAKASEYAALRPDTINSHETRIYEMQASTVDSISKNQIIDVIKQVSVDGVPFLEGVIWSATKEGDSCVISTSGITADSLFLLGCINSEDKIQYNWRGSTGFNNLLIGNELGSLSIKYKSGVVDTIPLVLGYTIWLRNSYACAVEPYKSDPAMRRLLDSALCVANGIDGKDPYFLKIALRSEPVESIKISDNESKSGYPKFQGVTFGGVKRPGLLDTERYKMLLVESISPETERWLESHTLTSADPYPALRQKAVEQFRRAICTCADDVNFKTIAATKPEVTSDTFPGPKVRFFGSPEAAIMTNVYYENANGLLSRIDEDGMVHESAYKADNYPGWIGRVSGLGAFYGDAYTRNHSSALLSNMGFTGKAEKAADFFDKWMMYYPKSYPELQIDSRPVPTHASVIANKPHVYPDMLSKMGWPTKYKIRDYGNPETDAHGMLLLGRYRTWAKSGRSSKWVEDRWEVIKSTAEWIPWCLDNPELSFSEHGVLYAESEAGMCTETLCCNAPCYFGLLSCAEMADAANKTKDAKRWREQAERLLSGMNAYFPAQADKWGDVWDSEKVGGWSPASVMMPLIMAADLYGYDAVNHMPDDWADRSRRSYDMMLTKLGAQYCDASSMGYGQGFLTESALLLDRMGDASHMANWIARLCFSPRQPHPYRVPESAAIDNGGSAWARGGDLGNLFQMNEVNNAIQIILGVNDWDPLHLMLMPRLPLGWTGVEVSDWPVRVMSAGKSEIVNLSYSMKREKNGKSYVMDIDSKKVIDKISLRAGPFSAGAESASVVINGSAMSVKLMQCGDSKWAWVDLPGGMSRYQARISVKG